MLQSNKRDQILNVGVGTLAAIGVAFLTAQVVLASEPMPTSYATISGVAHFEKRHTVTPMNCTVHACAKPQLYWELVVDAQGSKYELDQMLDVGQETAPASVAIDQVSIPAGAELSLVAQVAIVSRGYAILTDVQKIQVQKLETEAAPQGPAFFGWTCHSVGENLPIYVDVVRGANGSYTMKVSGEDNAVDRDVRTVAAFDSVSLNLSASDIDFAGKSSTFSAELDIDQRSGRLSDLDSVLKLTRQALTAQAIESVRLVCDRTR